MNKESIGIALILVASLVIAGWLDGGGPARPMDAPAIPTALVVPTTPPRPWQASATPAPAATPTPEPSPTVQLIDGQVVSDLTPLP